MVEKNRLKAPVLKNAQILADNRTQFKLKIISGLIEPDPERPPINMIDPTIDSFWNGVWLRTSKRNTRTYDEIFKCIPTDAITSFVGLKKYLEAKPLCKTNPEAAIQQVKQIQVRRTSDVANNLNVIRMVSFNRVI